MKTNFRFPKTKYIIDLLIFFKEIVLIQNNNISFVFWNLIFFCRPLNANTLHENFPKSPQSVLLKAVGRAESELMKFKI